MVAERRFAPISVVLACGLGVLLARLFQVEIVEHEIWAGQAANMLRSSSVLSSHRGRILDRNGDVLVHDEDCYRIEFCYRDFRRGHPLAQIAHARSALTMRPTTLAESIANAEAWASELVSLGPADLARIAEEPCIGSTDARMGADIRAQRASDLRFYLHALLALSPAERRAVKRAAAEPDTRRSYLELAAAARGTEPATELERLHASLASSRRQLAALADRVASELRAHGSRDRGSEAVDARSDAHSGASLAAHSGAPSGAYSDLVAVLDERRARIEDESADALFECAAGFAPGRISTAALASRFDLAWIAGLLRWDAARLAAWTETRRSAYERELARTLLPRCLARAAVVDDPDARPARLLDEIADLFRPSDERRRSIGEAPASWRDLDDLCVLAEIDTLFETKHRVSRGTEPAIALEDREIALAADELSDPWLAVGMVTELARSGARSGPPQRAAEVAERWRRLASTSAGLESPAALEEIQALVSDLESRFVARCDVALDGAASPADGDSSASPSAFAADRASAFAADRSSAFAADRLGRAREQALFILKDKQNRPFTLRGEPSYELVHLFSRRADEFPGFEVRDTTRRVAVARDPDGVPLARSLIGSLRRPSLSELFGQEEDERRLLELKYKLVRTDDDEREIEDLSARLFRADEWTAESGVEDYFDRELRGRHGYRESDSLEDRRDGARTIGRAAVDGLDVELTIDRDLQAAAQATLAHPELPSDSLADELWVENPVGAIALITLDGEVLAAASEPTRRGHPPTPGRDRQRAEERERTLRRPTFNPPGSVFKPFVAAYALDRMGFDPRREFTCSRLPDGGWGYRDMHCHSQHGPVDLHRALCASCNAYMAQLGETFTPDEILDMARTFGFGESTGIRHLGGNGRSGLGEDWKLKNAGGLPEKLNDRRSRMQFANGLSFIEATPMQVARATASLVTGELPELRIARAIGGALVPHASRPIGIAPEVLAFVRAAMRDVVADVHGTAYDKGLDRSSLSFTFACKTGSADTEPFREGPELVEGDKRAMAAGKMRKHTWISGWFPADEPDAILVVYLHDVRETASHTAVYVASQFLRTAAVRSFVEERAAARLRARTPSSGAAPADGSEAGDRRGAQGARDARDSSRRASGGGETGDAR